MKRSLVLPATRLLSARAEIFGTNTVRARDLVDLLKALSEIATDEDFTCVLECLSGRNV
jgi:hypothetical protein